MASTQELWQDVSRDRGIPEVTPQWVSTNIDAVRVIDVREPAELTGPLGRIEGIENVPLGDVGQASLDWNPEQPLVLLCRSGGRSGRAAQYLEQKGFAFVASMDGGMIEWNELGLPKV